MDILIRELTLEEESLVSAGMRYGYEHDIHNPHENLFPHHPRNRRRTTTREDWKAFQHYQQHQQPPYTYGCGKNKRKRCLTGSY